jgi:hypothetical protein
MMVNALDLDTSTMAQMDVHVGAVLAVSDPNGGCIVHIHTVIDHLRRETMGLQGELRRTVETADDGQCVGLRHIDDGSD